MPTSKANELLKYLDTKVNMLTNDLDYWFYAKDLPGVSGMPLKYKDIIRRAKKSIRIFDPYYEATVNSNWMRDADIFENLGDDIDLEIMTKLRKDAPCNAKTYLEAIIDDLKDKIDPEQHCKVGVKVFDNNEKQYDYYDVHDRFLIVDNDAYLVGSSVTAWTRPKSSTGICRLYEEEDIELVNYIFDYYWSKRTPYCRELKPLYK